MRNKILQLLGRDMKFSVRQASIYELTDLSVLNRLLNATTSDIAPKKWSIDIAKEPRNTQIRTDNMINSLSKTREVSNCKPILKSQMPNDLFILNWLRKVNSVLDSSTYASKVVHMSSMLPCQNQASICKEEVSNSKVSLYSESLGNLARCALIQICFERGYEYHEIARKIWSKSNFAIELSLYAIKRFNLKCSEGEFISSIERTLV